ncbi:MAG: alanine dehydrogenase [Clostridia bacterium]|nr:alanine dehydrogenase [Clostridia bacterium]
MIIGTTKERKNNEFRVGLTPSGVKELVNAGNTVYVEHDAGLGAGFPDEKYVEMGGKILGSEEEVFEKCDLVIKVKELEPEEFHLLREGQMLFTYLHLASNPDFARVLLEKKVTALAYETIKDSQGNLPCLRPMSQIAGRLAIHEGTKYLQRSFGGRGIMLGGVPGVERGKIVILGAGVSGLYSAKAAVGVGAEVTVLDRSLSRLEKVNDLFGSSVTELYLNEGNIEETIKEADLVICAILVPGDATPKLIRREHLKLMKKGAVIVDISIDQGGCCETSHVTTHENPVFIEDGIVHYCVGNMPGAVPYTSTVALTSETIKYIRALTEKGLIKALKDDPGFMSGLNIIDGKCVNAAVANALSLELSEVEF